jgi:hypothetical protein
VSPAGAPPAPTAPPAPSAPMDRAAPAEPAHPARLAALAEGLAADGVYDPDPDGERHFRIGAACYPLSAAELRFFEDLGPALLAFYQAVNGLYRRSARGTAPAFAARWLDQGKPDDVLRLARMGRFKQALPRVLRPDVFPTAGGFVLTELDSVPGGIGLTDALNARYAALGQNVVGGADGMAAGMEAALRAEAPGDDPTVAVVVSDESAAYRPEMRHLALRLKARGLSTHLLEPDGVGYDEAGLWLTAHGERCRIDVLYRFFELFDLPNVPKSEPILYAARKGQVALTPPPKPQLEEKLALALFHHPALAAWWKAELAPEHLALLGRAIPPTWVLDPAPVPAHAVIPGLTREGAPVQSWEALKALGQKARTFVVKPSGFSELAWGGRGVVIGHDMAEADWAAAVDRALAAFPRLPHVLQPFEKAEAREAAYLGTDGIARMHARPRLCPYYFVTADGGVRLGGVLATLCPKDKKRIHGMRDAVIVPCSGP